MSKYFFFPSPVRRALTIGTKLKRIKILCNDRFEPFIHQQCPSVLGIYNDVQFVTNGPCDLIIVLNKFDRAYQFAGRGIPIFLWLIEPPDYLQLYTEHADISFFEKIFTCRILPGFPVEKQVITPPFVHWHHAYSSKSRFLKHGYLPYSELVRDLSKNDKVNKIFLIDSYINNIAGHQDRINFVNSLKDSKFIDLYGSYKWDVHPRFVDSITSFKYNIQKKYLYSLVVENQKDEIYWSEKITDSFLAFSYPIYFGSQQITNFFPGSSLINLPELFRDYKDFEKFFASAKDLLKEESLVEARNLVLNDYNLFNILSKLI